MVLKSKNNNDEGQFQVGLCYYNGDGVDKDLSQSFYWFNKSSEQKNDKALFRMALFYIEGIYVSRDIYQGRKYMLDAALKGNINATRWLNTHDNL